MGLLLLVGAIAWLLSILKNKEVFSKGEMDAFKRAEDVQTKLTEVQKIVAAPKATPPDYSIAVTVPKPKP